MNLCENKPNYHNKTYIKNIISRNVQSEGCLTIIFMIMIIIYLLTIPQINERFE